ncbi:MAG TPA: tyrosine-type recombinase/integrase [Fimbriimonadaceae bacterium]|nr:tyrosine-type recombinase/integrase [Fimbriimonadaceae bacterium]
MKVAKAKRQATRRKKGEGTVVFRDGSWYPRFRHKGRPDEYGDAWKSWEEAENQRKQMLTGINPRFLPTLQNLYLTLLQEVYPHRLDTETIKLHETFYRRCLLDSQLGGMRIDQIKKGDVQAFIDRFRPHYKRSSLRRWVSCIHAALEYAVEDRELITKNVAKRIDLPKPEPKVKRALSPEQAHELPVSLSKYPRLAAMIAVMVDTGMRPGEVCALQWGNLDQVAGTITITHTMTRDRRLKPPKDGEHRKVFLTTDALEALLAQPRIGRFIFTTDEGRVMRPDWLGQQFRRHREKAGFAAVRLRDMRKTFSSIGLAINPKGTQETLGHSTLEMTADGYAEASEADLKAAVQGLAEKVGKRGIFAQKVQDRGSKEKHPSSRRLA